MTLAEPLVLVLGGGNALGAYHAGVYQALHEAGREPDWIVATSAGAITGALIAGNAPSDRLDRLAAFWQPGAAGLPDWMGHAETVRRSAAVAAALAGGRPGAFAPLGPLGSWWYPDALAAAPSLFDSQPMAATLARLADFDRVNAGVPRLTVAAVDLESGEDVVFNSGSDRITPDHVRASGALLPVLPAVEIAGRRLVDGGFSANVPLDPVLGDPPDGPTLCIAVDLLPLHGGPPRTLGESIGRAQDIAFAAQTRRTITRWREAYALDPRLAQRSLTLATLTYAAQAREVAGKAMDFSAESTRERWDAGLSDTRALLGRLARSQGAEPRSGLTIADHPGQASA